MAAKEKEMKERSDIEKVVRRIRDYKLWVDAHQRWWFDEKIVSKNQIRCMLSNDLELDTQGKVRQKIIDWCIDKCAEVILEHGKNAEEET